MAKEFTCDNCGIKSSTIMDTFSVYYSFNNSSPKIFGSYDGCCEKCLNALKNKVVKRVGTEQFIFKPENVT